MIDQNLLEAVAKSGHKENWIKLLNEVKNQVADIRKGNYSNETRKAVIEVIDSMILDKIKVLSQEPQRAEPDDYK
jgi:hypothetical protein